MNHLESLRILVTNRKGNLPAQIREFLKSAPDYREIEKVEYGPCPRGHLWYVYVNGEKFGEPCLTSGMTEIVSDWLRKNSGRLNLIIKPSGK